MAKRTPMIVVDQNGLEGTVVPDMALSADSEQRLLVRFESGEQVMVPRELLKQQADGRYRLLAGVKELAARQSSLRQADVNNEQILVIPVTEEQISVQKRKVETGGVEIRKSVHEHTEIIDEPLQSEEVEIARVPINRIVEAPVPVRHEGDTLIISLLEEVLVVEKRLMLREEVHIKKLSKDVHEPQEVLLREERVEVVRKAGIGQGIRQDVAQEE